MDSRLSGQASILLYRNDPSATGFEAGEEPPVQAVLALSQYNEQLALLGRPPISLSPGAYRIVEDSPVNGASHWRWLIVEDPVVEQLEIQNQCWSANYAGNAEETERAIFQLIAPMDTTRSVFADSRLEAYMDMMGNKILALFLGLYLGFTFLLAAAAVLALQQLSQGADNTRRYAVLRRLGAEEKQVARSATQQVALAFLLPLVLALVHSVVGMKAANEIIATAGRVDSAASSAVTAGVLLIVYGGYFLATSLACRRMAKNA
jgi:putative ABC transport system permease protein